MSKYWWMAFVMWVWGCGTDDLDSKSQFCVQDADCGAGSYCGPDKTCTSDCSAQLACAGELICSTAGRCVVANAACAIDDDCDSPPPGTSCDGDILVGSAAVGKCDTSGAIPVCVYAQVRTPCENGCSASGCALDACSAKVCDAPPAIRCGADGITKISYEDAGVCEGAGDCVYPEVLESCALGCVNGQCLAGACESITCDTPPKSKCNSNVAMRYDAVGTCDDSTGSPVCDYPLTFQDCGYVKGTCQDAACVDGITQVGGVVIVEYMANPAGGSDEGDEWFELTNTSGATIDLAGWRIVSKGTSSDQEHVIGDSDLTPVPTFAAGQTLLFAASATGTGIHEPDYIYNGVSLTNSTDWLALVNPAGEFADYVFYETGAVLDGRSRKFNPSLSLSATANDDFGHWCPSLTDPYTTGVENFGTPGVTNTPCEADPCAAFTCSKPENFCNDLSNGVQFLGNTATCEVTRFNNPFCDFEATNVACLDTELCASGLCEPVPTNLPAPGDVIFTEIMANPNKVSDTVGEWFELYNTTSNPLSLFSMVFQDSDTGSAADAYVITDIDATIPPNGYIVFARERDPALNGGIAGALYFSGRHLKNSAGTTPYSLAIANRDGTIIDSTYFGDAATGKSTQLDPDLYTAIDNDVAASWCTASQVYGDGDLGTPGAANVQCP